LRSVSSKSQTSNHSANNTTRPKVNATSLNATSLNAKSQKEPPLSLEGQLVRQSTSVVHKPVVASTVIDLTEDVNTQPYLPFEIQAIIVSLGVRDAWSEGGPAGRFALAATVFRLAAVSHAWSTEALGCFEEIGRHVQHEFALLDVNEVDAESLMVGFDDCEAMRNLDYILEKSVFWKHLDHARSKALYARYAAMKEASPLLKARRETPAQVFHRLSRK